MEENRNRQSICEGCAESAPFLAGFATGMEAGQAATLYSLERAADIVNVYRNGDYTVIEGADGEKTKVKYDPSYGYAYDPEKALMAALLKRVLGNRYIRVLRKFAGEPAMRGRDMIRKPAVPELPYEDDGMAGAFRDDGGESWQDFFDGLDDERQAEPPDACEEGLAEALEAGLSVGDDIPAAAVEPECAADPEPEDEGMAGAFDRADDAEDGGDEGVPAHESEPEPEDEGMPGAFEGDPDDDGADDGVPAHEAEPEPEDEGMAEAFEGAGGDGGYDAVPEGEDDPEPEDEGMAGAFDGCAAFPECGAPFFGATE